jgi:hypothetical protein
VRCKRVPELVASSRYRCRFDLSQYVCIVISSSRCLQEELPSHVCSYWSSTLVYY